MERFIVTIDGPAGSGKSTIAKLLSKNNGFIHINSGLLYRAIAYILGEQINEDTLDNVRFTYKINAGQIKIIHKSEILNNKLLNENVAKIASKIATIGYVREFINWNVRKIAKKGKFVIDGRDCGSVIFPEADVKIFLDASLEERARRRAIELNKSTKETAEEIKLRDKQDKERNIAPLIVPDGATIIDTTGLTIQQVYDKILKLLEIK